MTIIAESGTPTVRVVVPGLEARHAWNGLLTLGGLDSWPRHRIVDIGGLRATADGESTAEPATGRPGEVPRQTFDRGKTVTYECVTEAQTLAELRLAQAARAAAFADPNTVGTMLITCDPLLPDASPPVFFRARRLSLLPGTERPADPMRYSRGYEQPFSVALRLHDSRIYRAQQAGPIETAALVAQTGISLRRSGYTHTWTKYAEELEAILRELDVRRRARRHS